MSHMPRFEPATSTMVSRIQLWSYDQLIRQALEDFAEGNNELEPLANTRIDSFFNTAIDLEEKKDCNKYDESYGIRMMWNFVSHVIPTLTNEESSIGGIAETLKENIRFLDEALCSKYSQTEDDGSHIERELKKLKSETVILAVVKFLHNKSQSRILYNRYKECLSRFQKESIKCVLQELIDPKKVLKPYAEYLKLVQDTVHKILSVAENTLIFKIAQNCSERSQDGDGYAKLIDDVDSASGHSSSESEVGAEKSSSQGSTSICIVENEEGHSKTHNRPSVKSGDSVEVVEVSSTSKIRRPPFPPPSTKKNTFLRVRSPTNLSTTNRSLVDSDKFKFPPYKKPLPRAASYAGGKMAKSITASSKRSYSSRQRHEFTPLQDAYIIMGMKKFGSDKREWKKMLDYYSFPEYRTGMHLKDRWRTLLNQGEVKVVHGEIQLSDKYTLLIKYLETKNVSQNHKKDKTKSKIQMQKSSSKEHLFQQTPDSTYLSPVDLSDTDDRESPIPVPGLENVKRWIKTGKTVTEKTPPRRIPPLLITRTREERRKRNMSGISCDLQPSPEIVTTDTNGENSGEGQKPNLKNHDQNNTRDSPLSSPGDIIVPKKCEFEKNSNGKYMKKQKKSLNEPRFRQVILEQRQQADPNKFHNVAENQRNDQMSSEKSVQGRTEKESVEQTASPVVLESDDCGDKRLLPHDDTDGDMDLISVMEEEGLSRAEEDRNKSLEEYSQSTIGLLEGISSETESQTQIPSQTEKCDTHVTQRKSKMILNTLGAKAQSEEQECQPSTLDILLAATESQDSVSISQKLGEDAESQVQTSAQDRKQGATPSQSSYETTVDPESVTQLTTELLNNPKSDSAEDIASETSCELSADGDGDVLNLELSQASLSFQTPSCISETVSHGDDSDASVVLYIDEDWSADANDKTLVEEKSVTAPQTSDPEQSSDGGYDTSVVKSSEEAKESSRLRNCPPITTVKDKVDLNTQNLEAMIETPVRSPTGSSILNPRSPMSEYYTASEGSLSEKDKQALQQSDAEASDTNNETVIHNTTVKDAEIPNNIEQCMAESPSLSNSEQSDTLDLLTSLENNSQNKVSQDLSTVKNAADALRAETPFVTDYNNSVKSFENPTDVTISDSPCRAESENAILTEANELCTSPAPIFLSNYIKTERKDFPDTLSPPPNEIKVEYFNVCSTDKVPILRLNRIKNEPGVFSTDVCMCISSDSYNSEGINTSGSSHSHSSKTIGIDVSPVGATHAMASRSVNEINTIHTEERALDLSVRRTSHLAKKSTGGLRKISQLKDKSNIDATKNGRTVTASCSKKTANGSKARKNKESKAESGGDATTTRKISSKRDGSGTDATDSSDSKLNHKKRKLLMQSEGVPLKLSKDDDLLFNTGTEVKNAKAFGTFGSRRCSRRKAWSQDEDDNLLEGVQIYGEGRWKQILDHFPFRNRTVVNLKDRYRILKEN